ncbi:MAG: zf-HC2 domain-containing protein [Candidatus Latescibacter sp.]|nr:zf-HC2 domain-containing protein [Candidatus Latescibacter sp.]
MKCNRVMDLLPFFDDGSLAPQIAEDVKRHLAGCADCRRELREMTGVVRLVRETIIEQAPVPDSRYLEMINKRIRRKKAERTTALWAVPAAAVIFFAVFVGAYSLFLGNNGTGFMAGEKHSNKGQTAVVFKSSLTDEDVAYHNLTTYANVSIDDMLNTLDESELTALLSTDER